MVSDGAGGGEQEGGLILRLRGAWVADTRAAMEYRVGRDGSELGAFSGEQLREGLQTGQFVPSDLAWRVGMQQWMPIEQALAWMPGAQVLQGTVLPATPMAGGPVHVGVGVMPVPGTAIASLILGLFPVVACGIGVILCVPGVICGHMALSAINAPGARFDGRGLAITGLILNYFWLVLAALVILAIVLIFGVAGAAAAADSGAIRG